MLQSLISAFSVVLPCFYPTTQLGWAKHEWWYWLVAVIFFFLCLLFFLSDYIFMRRDLRKEQSNSLIRSCAIVTVAIIVGIFWPIIIEIMMVAVMITFIILVCMK